MGRRTRTLLPITHSLLESKIDKQTAQKWTAQKKTQAIHYNRGTKSLAPLRIGETIRMQLPGERNWSIGRCLRILSNWSYEVEMNGSRIVTTVFSCARRQNCWTYQRTLMTSLSLLTRSTSPIKYRFERITPRHRLRPYHDGLSGIDRRRNGKMIMNCSIDCHSCSLIFLD